MEWSDINNTLRPEIRADQHQTSHQSSLIIILTSQVWLGSYALEGWEPKHNFTTCPLLCYIIFTFCSSKLSRSTSVLLTMSWAFWIDIFLNPWVQRLQFCGWLHPGMGKGLCWAYTSRWLYGVELVFSLFYIVSAFLSRFLLYKSITMVQLLPAQGAAQPAVQSKTRRPGRGQLRSRAESTSLFSMGDFSQFCCWFQ